MTAPLPLKTIATRIRIHLERIEALPKALENHGAESVVHPPNVPYCTKGAKSAPLFYRPGAWVAGGWVNVRYVSYQLTYSFRRADAEAYLAWLDAGNVGKHYVSIEALRRENEKVAE